MLLDGVCLLKLCIYSGTFREPKQNRENGISRNPRWLGLLSVVIDDDRHMLGSSLWSLQEWVPSVLSGSADASAVPGSFMTTLTLDATEISENQSPFPRSLLVPGRLTKNLKTQL